MSKEELKPIDVSKYMVTESGNVIKGEEKKTTKEELEKEAYLFAKNSKDVQNFECGFDIAFKSYLAGAESREKRIAELEAQIEKMNELINRYYGVCVQIPKEYITMVFDSCMEDTRKMVKEKEIKEND